MNNAIQDFLASAEHSILGKQTETKLALCCFLSHGHLLIEDVPGMGKTTFAKTLAKLLDLSFARIQFTNDLMPSDLVGIQIFDAKEGKFNLIHGPIFHQFILADELNRGTPKTQSALLEAMEEKQVTLDGNTINLPHPFFVVATQNPRSQIGTHHLPESQLDRFMMKIKIGYPDAKSEKNIISSDAHTESYQKLKPAINPSSLADLYEAVKNVKVSDKLLDYVLRLLDQSRNSNSFQGLSPRAGKDIIKAAKAWALISGRDYVLPDDVQIILPSVVSHRLAPFQNQSFDQDRELTQMLIKTTKVD
ncbi:MoxR family ATPase [Bacteriovorax stolpii]|uniref:AAA family ATPase n=1 Tax=Bacteriovorax stolpii TaxID=960 RepID=A0A2K9NM25_BACTC|nr:MoxR family ATPase [Bacteriovorax stolpii]AUN96561.1 AAA family ATPase [Bacteriovorax stolpii]QDK43507.1 MoxR family ATPase [Bacteriovorax stolpii]TDP53918.1 MoxR-like ATPase [Bacteriovorax stolpii]